jgi:hypothetical protein
MQGTAFLHILILKTGDLVPTIGAMGDVNFGEKNKLDITPKRDGGRIGSKQD